MSFGGRHLVAALGRGGLCARKREGDGATPRVTLTALAALTRGGPALRRALTGLPSRPVRHCDGWCDDTAHASYNRYVSLPIPASHERLSRPDELYDAVVITDHNRVPRLRGVGSAIFIHVAREGLLPTEGCVAFPLADWRRGRVPLGRYLVGTDPRPVR